MDELRFHLLDGTTKLYEEVIHAASDAGINVGIELPCEPDKEESLFELLEQLDQLPVQFLNLNELEITTGNQENMDVRGFNLSSGLSAAAEGSFELGVRLKEAANDKSFHLKFCTASYKDAGQLRADSDAEQKQHSGLTRFSLKMIRFFSVRFQPNQKMLEMI